MKIDFIIFFVIYFLGAISRFPLQSFFFKKRIFTAIGAKIFVAFSNFNYQINSLFVIDFVESAISVGIIRNNIKYLFLDSYGMTKSMPK